MVFMLLPILFAIAFGMIFVGLRLSHKTQEPVRRQDTHGVRGGSTTRRLSTTTDNVQRVRSRRYIDLDQREAYAGNKAGAVALFGGKSFLTPGSGKPPRSGKPPNGMTIFLVGLSVSFVVGLLCMKIFAPSPVSVNSMSWMDVGPSASSGTPLSSASTNNGSDPTAWKPVTASSDLKRLAQMDPAQYASTQEFNTWAASACSATSMTEVINSYGHNYRITDILQVESGIGEISPDLGLLHGDGIERTMEQFGFKTVSFDNMSLDSVISIANQGRPVIVGFPPARWAGGHLLVVTGGDANTVRLADSSQFHMLSLPRDRFLHYWGGYAEVAVPKNQ